MKFGPVPLGEAAGAILAHSHPVAEGRLRKGLILQQEHLAALARAGVQSVVVARLEAGDVHEDEAARRLAEALAAPGLRLARATGGRVNLVAESAGVLEVARAQVEALNRTDPMITLATLPEWAETTPGRLLATVKIIAYAVGEATLARACAAARGALVLHPPRLATAALIQTTASDKLAEKGRRALAARLARFDARLIHHARTAHQIAPLAAAFAEAPGEVLFILTDSATSDRADIAPAALAAAGGRLIRFGLPVDPGNLLFVGALGERPVIGLPGCARSLAPNGADRVIARVLCACPPGSADIAAMGVGGLLKEMPSRPQPREK